MAEGVVLGRVDVHHEGTKDLMGCCTVFRSKPGTPLVFFVLFVSFVPLWFK